jgi:hypothetical protein
VKLLLVDKDHEEIRPRAIFFATGVPVAIFSVPYIKCRAALLDYDLANVVRHARGLHQVCKKDRGPAPNYIDGWAAWFSAQDIDQALLELMGLLQSEWVGLSLGTAVLRYPGPVLPTQHRAWVVVVKADADPLLQMPVRPAKTSTYVRIKGKK